MSARASPEQQECVHALLAGNNVVIEASAGAGKSTTFYHTARAWLAQHPDAPVLLVCFNAVLRAEALRKIEELQLKVDCFTIHALAAVMYQTRVSDTLSLYQAVHGVTPPKSPATYSLVLIDEAQDLNEDHTDVINALQKVLPAPMQYMVVGDPRQEIYAHARGRAVPVLADPAQYLQDNGKPWRRQILNTSYRLTAPVCALLNQCFRHPILQVPIEPGNVRFRLRRPRYIIGNKESTDLFDVIRHLLETYTPGDIMILAPTVALTKHRCQRLAFALHTQLKVPIFSTHKQRSDLSPAMMHGKVFLSTYHQSKGYERPCVVVLGVDEHEWVLNKSPQADDGQPLVHNSLHVALTRAQEQLVLFQHYFCGWYPTVNLETVHEFADVVMVRVPLPRPPPARSLTGEISDTWLVSFQPRSTLCRLLELLPNVEQQASSESVEQSVELRICRVTPDSAEDVMDAYLVAVTSWTERLLLQSPCRLEWMIREKIKPHQVPLCFKTALEKKSLNEASDWLALALIYNTMIHHDYPHELYQLQHLDWIGPKEIDFVTTAVEHLKTVLPSSNIFWHERASRVLEGRTVRAQATLVSYSDTGPEPWQFSMNDSCTEANLLLGMVHMWVFRAKKSYVYSIATQKRYVLQAPENLNTFLGLLLSVKLNS